MPPSPRPVLPSSRPVTRGRLRVYLGASPGVGTTHAVLDEGIRRAERGRRLGLGPIDTKARPELDAMVHRLCELGATPAGEPTATRRFDVVLVDDLARPGPNGRPRWEDITPWLDAGTDVVTTVDISELASMRDAVAALLGAVPDHVVPDEVVRGAEQIELVDFSPEALRRRLAHGRIVAADQLDAPLAHRFRPEILGALRRLSLLWMLDHVEAQLARDRGDGPDATGTTERERVVVALSGEGGEHLVRRAARLAGGRGAALVGVHVARRQAAPGPDLEHQRRVLHELGGTYREVVADDVGEALADFVRSTRATTVVLGDHRGSAPTPRPRVLDTLVRRVDDAELHLVPTVSGPRSPRRVPHGPARRRPRWQTATAWAGCLVVLPLLTFVLTRVRDHVAVGTALLLDLCVVLSVSALGGLAPGLVASVVAFGLTNWFLIPPLHTLDISAAENVVALTVFVLVTVVVSVLVDRVARRSREAAQARAEATALARSAATLVGADDPLPELLEQVRSTFSIGAAAVLERNGTGWWPTQTSGTPELLTPEDGTAISLSPDGEVVLVVSADGPGPERMDVLRAFVDQLALAVQARRLRSEAADAALIAEAAALRSALLQAVSHDFRTPLATIRAAATGLLQEDVAFSDEDRHQLLADLDGAADKLDRMVRNLLDMTRIQAGALELRVRPVALEDVVAAALSGLPGSDAVVLDVSESLPLVVADEALLERAVANLVSNALTWSPPDEPVVVRAGAVGGEVDLRIIDRGPGIPAAERERVFQPFQRLGDRSSEVGAGLGLAIARGFVDAMGGRLTIEDTPGGGLTMSVRLLAAEDPAVAP